MATLRTGLALAALILPSTASANISETHQVEMRDGTLLATDVYRPSDESKAYPTILIRTPYGKGHLEDELASIFTDRFGFTLIIQDNRGRGASEGLDQVFLTDGWGELQDGYDTLDWIVEQSWNDGNVGEMGVSAMGIAANLNAGTFHPALKTIHVGIAGTNFYEHMAYQGGSFRNALIVDWLEGQGAEYMIDSYQEHPFYDEYWEGFDVHTRYDNIDLPIFHYGGFHDCMAQGTMDGFVAMQERAAEDDSVGPQKLLMGPWTHVDAGAFSTRQGELEYPAGSMLPLGEVNPVSWFSRWLQGEERPIHDQEIYPVRYYVMGDPEMSRSEGNHWEMSKVWPVNASSERLYLQNEGALDFDEPRNPNDPLTYTFNPSNPSPTIGGRELSLESGPRDQSPLLDRDDVLMFQTEPMEDAYKIVGPVKAVLYISSDAPDTDFTVRLTDVYPDGRSMLVLDGIQRTRARLGNTAEDESFLTPGEVVRIEVDLGSTAQVFDKGHRLQVLVSSSNHRRFEVAKNTADPFWADVDSQIANNTVYFDDVFSSHLVLPVPRQGASRMAPDAFEPTEAQIRRALQNNKRDQVLDDSDMETLSYTAGKALLEQLYGQVIEAHK